MWSYVTSYLQPGAPAEEPKKKDDQQMSSYSQSSQLESSGPEKQNVAGTQDQAPTGFLNKIYTKMSGHPTCEVVLRFNPNRKYFTAGDDLIGKVILKTTVEGQKIDHQGIKVSLLGMILQMPDNYNNHTDSYGNRIKMDPKRSEITAQTISQYRQYTFMQIQKEVEIPGDFVDQTEIEFHFKKLDEELSEHETYNGVGNFIKYFIKVHMNYQGGSIVSGNVLEKLHEIKVRNHYNERAAKKKLEEIKAAQSTEESSIKPPANTKSDDFGFEDNNQVEQEISQLDQTFESTSTAQNYAQYNQANEYSQNQNQYGDYDQSDQNAAFGSETYKEPEETKQESQYSNVPSTLGHFSSGKSNPLMREDDNIDDQIAF